jgi:hypothetical protein
MNLYEINASTDVIPSDQLNAHLPAHVAAAIEGRDVVVFAVADDVSDTADFDTKKTATNISRRS